MSVVADRDAANNGVAKEGWTRMIEAKLVREFFDET